MTRSAKCFLLLVLAASLAGCLPQDEVRESARSTATTAPPPAAEIVFRARYYMSKECREGPKGELGLGDHPVCEVVDVLHGKLALQRLLHPHLPEGLEEGKTYTFRWKLSESCLKEVRKAEAGGYTGMWVDGEEFELVAPKK